MTKLDSYSLPRDSRACRRHRYSVAAQIFSSSALSRIGRLCGGSIFFSTASLRPGEYLIVFSVTPCSSLTVSQYGDDFYPDTGVGNLQVICPCEDADDAVCGHATALLYAYADQENGTDELLNAADDTIEERVTSGRSEVRVRHLEGKPWLGAWRAKSITSSTHFPQQYRVNIRSFHRRGNYCSCPDFAHNQLGTCKHIEAVLHRIGKRRDYQELKDQTAPCPYVYLSWEAEDPPRIALHRTHPLPDGLRPILEEYFDAAGLFKGRLPEAFFRFSEQARDRDDIDVGEDALGHARQLATTLAHRERAREIRHQITSIAFVTTRRPRSSSPPMPGARG